jgi:hypothetical protein
MSQVIPVRVLAAQAFVKAGELDRAEKLASGLASESQPEPQAYAKIKERRTRPSRCSPMPASCSIPGLATSKLEKSSLLRLRNGEVPMLDYVFYGTKMVDPCLSLARQKIDKNSS